MDKLNTKIIQELDKDTKISITKLAKKIRVSQQVADYRLKKLTQQETIKKFGTFLNLSALGLEHYKLFLTFNATDKVIIKQLFNYLKKKSGVFWAARIGGKYDLLITLFVKNFYQLDTFLENINSEFPGLVKDCKSCYGIDHYIYKHKFISKDYSHEQYGCNENSTAEIDNLDKEILKRLTKNCRTSALEIANQINTTYKTVINRIKVMENKKIILTYRLFLNTKELPFCLLLSFKNYSTKKEKKLISYLGELAGVTQTIRLFGLWNLFIHIRADNNEELQKLIIKLRNKFDIINEHEIIPIFQDIAMNLFP